MDKELPSAEGRGIHEPLTEEEEMALDLLFFSEEEFDEWVRSMEKQFGEDVQQDE